MNAPGRYDSLHGDEIGRWPTPAEDRAIERMADELIADKLRDFSRFQELADGIDADAINEPLHRALCNIDDAINGDAIALQGVLRAISDIQRIVQREADIVWRDDAEAQAACEIMGVAA